MAEEVTRPLFEFVVSSPSELPVWAKYTERVEACWRIAVARVGRRFNYTITKADMGLAVTLGVTGWSFETYTIGWDECSCDLLADRWFVEF